MQLSYRPKTFQLRPSGGGVILIDPHPAQAEGTSISVPDESTGALSCQQSHSFASLD
jgi:hypothetical protein